MYIVRGKYIIYLYDLYYSSNRKRSDPLVSFTVQKVSINFTFAHNVCIFVFILQCQKVCQIK